MSLLQVCSAQVEEKALRFVLCAFLSASRRWQCAFPAFRINRKDTYRSLNSPFILVNHKKGQFIFIHAHYAIRYIFVALAKCSALGCHMKRSFRIKGSVYFYLPNPRHKQLDTCDFLLKNKLKKITAGISGNS